MSATIDVDRVRRDTPACESVIHFNNAGAALMPDPVAHAVLAHLDLERQRGGYEAEAAAQPALEDFYDAFATLLGCGRDEIAYAESATRAWDMAVYALPLAPGDRVLTHDSDYASNHLALLQLSRRIGIELDLVPSDAAGQLDVRALERMIGPRTRAIALTHVPTQNGLVNPAEAVGRIARAHGLLYVLDACQSVGQLPVDVRRIGCHVLSGTGRKFLRGPRGTGFLYVERALLQTLEPPFIDMRAATATVDGRYRLRADARRFEGWESFVAGRLGLRAAVRYLLALGVDAAAARINALAVALRHALGALPGVTVHDRGVERSGIVTFTVAGEQPAETAVRLRSRGANVSVTASEAAPLDARLRRLATAVRASVHYYNTEAEIAAFATLVAAR